MIAQTVTRFIVLSDLPGKYWSKATIPTDDVMEAKLFEEKPKGVPENRIRIVSVTIRELPYSMD